jgi:HEAT repeat protein
VTRPLPAILLILAAAAGTSPAAAGDDPSPYRLPEGYEAGEPLPDALRGAVARAVADVTRPTTPYAAREGWRVLAGIGRPAAPAAVEGLRGATWFGRALLVRALGAMQDPALLPLLVQAAGDPAWAVRESAAEGLGLAEGDEPRRLLAGLLGDGSWRVRRAALEAVRARALRGGLDRDEATRLLLPLGRDEDGDCRRAAWIALADLRGAEARPVLLEALDALAKRVVGGDDEDAVDPALRTALRILRGLGEAAAGDPAVLERLRALASETEHPLAGAAIREWFRGRGPGGLQDAAAVALLLRIYVTADVPESWAAAEQALVDLGADAAEPLLARITEPERPRREPIPHQSRRRGLDLALRLRPEGAAATLALFLRDRGLPLPIRVYAADLGSRTCPGELGPVFREVYSGGRGDSPLEANLLRGIAASGGDDVKGILARALLKGDDDGPPVGLRSAAVDLLERRPELRDAPVVLRALATETDPEVLVRLLPVAAEAAGAEAPAIVGSLLRDSKMRVRRAAAGALERSPGDAAVRLLLASLESENGDDDRLPLAPEAPPEPEPSAPAPDEESPAGRAKAERAARDEAARTTLAETRKANAASVRETVVSSLRFAAGPRAREVLVALLGHADPAVRSAAAANLRTLADLAAAPALAARVAAEADAGIREKLLFALADLGGPEADAALEKILAGEDGAIRTVALDALSRDGTKARAPEGTLRSLRRADASFEERAAAVQALGAARDPARTPLLLEILAGAATGEERRGALQALGRTRDPAAVAAVAALLPRGDSIPTERDESETAAFAVETLGDLRAAEGAPPLAALLARTLPAALSGGRGGGAAAARQFATLAFHSLGKCGGDAALDALVLAAFHPGFSRAAEAATADPLRLRPPRKEEERWTPELPEDLRIPAFHLAGALARWKDREIAAALTRRLAAMRADGSVHSLSEEWLSWLANALASPHPKLPNRPRWFAKVALLRVVLANPPRLTEADGEAARNLFLHESELSMEYAAAARTLEAWRDAARIHDPLRADHDARTFDGLAAVVAAAEALKGGGDVRAAEAAFEAAFAAAKDDRVARLVVEVLGDLDREPALGVRFAELAVRVDADADNAMNLRALGEARLAAGDAAGSADALGMAVRAWDAGSREPARASAWTRCWFGRALLAVGRQDEALRALGQAAALNDTVLDWCERDPSLAPLRDGGRLDEALEPARRVFE